MRTNEIMDTMIQTKQLPELQGNGDQNTELIVNVFANQLKDDFTLVGLYDIYGLNDGPDDHIVFVGDTEETFQAFAKALPQMEQYTAGMILRVAENADLKDLLCTLDEELIEEMYEMGRYPRSQSEGDEFMISFSSSRIVIGTHIFQGYWFDDSSR